MVSVPNVLPVVLDHKDRDRCLPKQVMTLQESGIQCDRGVDAPETKQPYGPQAKAVLLSLVEGRSLRVLVYGVDQYGRIVADIYCKNVFIQEVLFKKGCVWHYVQYDRRPEFAQWEKDARAARVGLWANANPEKPWDYRRQKKNQGSQH
jgi:endonuclease YncB( thermonuclease family)